MSQVLLVLIPVAICIAVVVIATVRPTWWRRLVGANRLSFGYCPCCASSPPDPECPVCRGSYHYGRHPGDGHVRLGITPEIERTWRTRWIANDYCVQPPGR